MVRSGLSWVGSGWPTKNTGQVTGQPTFPSGKKNRVRVRYFSGQARKFWPVLPCLDRPIFYSHRLITIGVNVEKWDTERMMNKKKKTNLRQCKFFQNVRNLTFKAPIPFIFFLINRNDRGCCIWCGGKDWWLARTRSKILVRGKYPSWAATSHLGS